MQPWILLEDTTGDRVPGAAVLFENPVAEICCRDAALLLTHLALVDTWRCRGYYVVGFISYEAGYVLQGLSTPYLNPPQFPLLHFLVFSERQKLTPEAIQAFFSKQLRDNTAYSVSQLQLSIDALRYAELFTAVQTAIREGESYQINLTAKYQFAFSGSSFSLYDRLRSAQRVAYSAFLYFPQLQIASLSPELFFSKRGTQLCAKPMKGTAMRADDPVLDEQYKQQLSTDPKARAENSMIVDLLRNDLSRCARPGTLATPNLFEVESYSTLHQLVSTITCQVEKDLPFNTLIDALFPCGSITGAPKRRTMEWIHGLESEARHIYTGAIGYITPENDMCFNVAIRTLLLHADRGELGVGGGVVADSTASAEFAELQLKARYFTQAVGA